MSFFNDNEDIDTDSLPDVFQHSPSTSQKRIICSVCNCTMYAGDECIICQQNYQNSVAIDSGGLLSFNFPPLSEPAIPCVSDGGESFVPDAEPAIPCVSDGGESFFPSGNDDEELPDPTILRDRRCNHFNSSNSANLVKRHNSPSKGIKEHLIESFKSDKVN